MESVIHFCKTQKEFTASATEYLLNVIVDTLKERGECIVGLSGGSTPESVYTSLSKKDSVDWSQVYFFLLDERHVESSNKNSNQYLLRQTLLKSGNIPEENCIFPNTSLDVTACTAEYSHQLANVFSNHAPDIIVLGMGNDGHIASLFPPVAETHFGETLVVHTQTDEFAVKDRISVSPLVLLSATKPMLLLKGKQKQKVFEECTAAAMDPIRWPLHIVQATKQLEVFIGQ